MTLREIISLIQALSGDVNEKKYPYQLLLSLANDGQDEMAVKARCLQGYITASTVIGTREYDLPATFVDVDYRGAVSYDDKRLDQVTMQWLDDNESGWREEDSATPERYYLRRAVIGFQPKPDAVKTIKIYYYKHPTAMASLTDIPFNADRRFDTTHKGIVYYVLMMLAMMPPKDTENLNIYKALYGEKLAELINLANEKDDLRFGLVPQITRQGL